MSETERDPISIGIAKGHLYFHVIQVVESDVCIDALHLSYSTRTSIISVTVFVLQYILALNYGISAVISF